jgi:hypothetical protein
MTQDRLLTAAEVERLTGKKRHKAQARQLTALGYRFILAATGEPLVRWSDLDEQGKPAQRRGHRWDRIGGVRQIRP